MRFYVLKTIFKKKLGVCISMIIMISLGISIFVGMNSFLKTLDESLHEYVVNNNYPDIVIDTDVFDEKIIVINNNNNKNQEEIIQEYLDEHGYTNKYIALIDYKNKNNIKDDQEAIDRLIKEYYDGSIEYSRIPISNIVKSINGVLEFDTRINFYTTIHHLNKNYSSKIIVYKSDKFNNFNIWQEAQRSNEYRNIYVEKKFADNNNIKLEDILEIQIEENNYNAYVQAIVTTPENLGSNLEYASVDVNYGCIYISQEELDLHEYDNYANQIFIKAENILSKDKIKESIIATLNKHDIHTTNSYTYEESNVNDRIYRNIDPIKTLCKIIPTFFYFVTIIILYLCFSIIVKSSRRNISIYRAIGIGIKTIKMQFCLLGVLIIILSCVLSIPICYCLVNILSNFYNDFFVINCIIAKVDYLYLIIAYLIALFTCIVAILINCNQIVKYKPIEAMSLETNDNYESPYLVRKVFKNTKPIFKFSLTTCLRNRSQLFFSVICITSTIALIFASFSFVAGNNVIIDSLFKDRINYDYTILFSKEPSQEIIQSIKNLDCVSDVENIKTYKDSIELNGSISDIVVNAIDTNSKLVRISNVDALPKQGIVLDQYSASKINAKVGDIVTFRNNKLEVVAISTQYVNRTEYTSYDQAIDFGESEYGCLVCKCNNYEELLDHVSKIDTYLTCKSTQELNKSVNEMFESYTFVSIILIVFSIIIGFSVVLICIKTNLIDRAKQISVLRALGYTTYEISYNNFVQLLIQLLISLLIGLPIGKGISTITLKLVETSDRTYPYANGIKEIVFTIVLVFSYMLLAQILAHFEVKKWQLSQEIKNND